ncbi:Uncharacterised protein [uncultured archaeon]|nr:Uncharacterised protein [uncultured archaeon]
MNKTGSTMKNVAIVGAGAVGVGISAMLLRNAVKNAVVLPDNLLHNLNEKGNLARGVEKDLFKNMVLTDKFRSDNGIGEGIVPEGKVSKKSVIAEMVENPHIEGRRLPLDVPGKKDGDRKFPVPGRKYARQDTLTDEFLKNNGIAKTD